MRVVHNRTHNSGFPDQPCKVVAQDGQFQSIDESRKLKWAALKPRRTSLEWALGADSAFERKMLGVARRLAGDPRVASGRDPTGGALFFVNPDMMDPSRCAWFAGLKRTAQIGSHVFMTHYQPGEARGGPALDCSEAGRGYLALRRAKGTGSAQAAPDDDAMLPPPARRPRDGSALLAMGAG